MLHRLECTEEKTFGEIQKEVERIDRSFITTKNGNKMDDIRSYYEFDN